MSKIDILRVRIDDVTSEELGQAIVDCVEHGEKKVFAYANVHAINLAQQNFEFRNFLNNSDILYCDGEGVRLGARMLGVPPPPRTALTRWIWKLCALLQQKNISVYLLGGQPDVVGGAAKVLLRRFSKLKLVGYHGGYFEKSGNENDEVIDQINSIEPNVLFVGFGMPDQEKWIEENYARLNVNALLPCGGMMDYLAGETTVAPSWMSQMGMEWLHRFMQEPGRLWRRYLLGNPMFIFRIFLQRLTKGRQS